MPLYSLYYYRKAQKLRPYDPRMLTALAEAYRNLSRWPSAIKCYEAAVNLPEGQDDPGLYYELAILYRDRLMPSNVQKVVENFSRTIACTEVETDQTLEACEYLATYHRDRKELTDAERYAKKLEGYGGKYQETAKGLLRQIRDLRSPSRSDELLQDDTSGTAL
eukprot:m.119690 g.119690  ORF g.119690 m.119690 type:complete len:164 (+) comp23193_c1_seq5:902-1393(+)